MFFIFIYLLGIVVINLLSYFINSRRKIMMEILSFEAYGNMRKVAKASLFWPILLASIIILLPIIIFMYGIKVALRGSS